MHELPSPELTPFKLCRPPSPRSPNQIGNPTSTTPTPRSGTTGTPHKAST
uniref:Uncharacterized protein n=1 Tax=Echinococcus granulosus TaxID=6210 RepID=A0A068WPF6_ECHGR|nr:hypothetical protein EgrG_000487200 [Echinococcus granulosus]